jgi:hypothetical protein
MNAIIARYKKMVLLAIILVTMSVGSVVFAGCSACAAAAAIRQSIQEAQAALIAAEQSGSRQAELDVIPSMDDVSRAPREELFNPYSCEVPVDCGINTCNLNCKLQTLFNCCVNTNQQVRCQGKELERCCKKLSHKIDDVEDLVGSQTDAAALSVIEGLIITQIAQSAMCCSVIESVIGNVDNTAFDIPDTDDIQAFVNATDVDVITWLKSLYALMYTIAQCACD